MSSKYVPAHRKGAANVQHTYIHVRNDAALQRRQELLDHI